MIHVVSVISELKLGGGENRLLNFARAIDRGRFRHTVVTVYAPNSNDPARCGSLRQAFDDAGIAVTALDVPHPGSTRRSGLAKRASTAKSLATAVAKLRRLFVALRADVVDAHLATALYTAVPAAASAGLPAAVTLYSELDLWKVLDRPVQRVVFAPLRRLNLGLCSAVITDSAARAADFRSYLGKLAPPMHVVPNGVQLDPPRRPRAEVLSHFGIPPDSRSVILGQIAGLVPYKGQALLIEAARRARDAGHDVRVLLVGDERVGPAYPAELRAKAETLGIADRLHMRAYPGPIADAWSIVDVHVHASSIDSMPNAVIEGMSLGKPAVVSAVGAIPEHVDHERTGLVIRPDDPAALATAVLRLLGDPAFAARLGEGARARYLERFTPAVTARQLERCLEQLVRTSPDRAVAGAFQ